MYIFHIFAKIYGLAPFSMTKDYAKSSVTLQTTIYSVIFGILMIFLMSIEVIWIKNIDEVQNIPHGTVLEFVAYAQYSLNYLSLTILYIFLFVNRANIANVFNDITLMWTLLAKLRPITCFRDEEFFRSLGFQSFLSFSQFFGFSIAIYSMSSAVANRLSAYKIQIFWFNIFFVNLLVTCYYFCGNLFSIWQIFRTINQNIDGIFMKLIVGSNTNTKNVGKLSNDIDKTLILYTKTISILQRTVENYVFSLVVAILLTVIELVAAVSVL